MSSSFFRPCRYCGRRIQLRQMPTGKWVAFEGGDQIHRCQIEADVASFEQYADVYVGFKCLSDYHGIPLTDARYRPAWEYADRRALLVLCHTWGASPLDGYAIMRQMAERYPRVKLLLGHSCHGEWDAAVQLARDFANLYLELTALFDDRGILEKFAAEAGSERMLFGTDLPWFDPHQAVGALLSAHISDEDRSRPTPRNWARWS